MMELLHGTSDPSVVDVGKVSVYLLECTKY